MVPIWVTLVLLIIVLIIIKSILFRYSKIKLLGDKIPGPNPYPIIGSAHLFLCSATETLKVIQRLTSEYGSVCRIWLARELDVILTNPKDFQLILRNSKQNTKMKVYSFMKPLLGDGLITSNGNIWQVHRKLLTPTFHFKILEHSIEVMHKGGQILLNVLDEKVGKPEFDIHDYVTKCTFDIVCGSAMGVEFNTQRSTDTSYFDAVIGATTIATLRMYNVWLQSDILFRLSGYEKKFKECISRIDRATNEIISKKKEILEKGGDTKVNSGTKYAAFLDMLLQENLTDKEIVDEVKTFTFAGHDTTSGAISFIMYVLSHHPDVQDKICEELEDASLLVDDTCPSMQQLNNLKYVECVIKETMRIYPPVPAISRELGEEVITTDGHRIPAGANVDLFIFGMHRNEEYYENCDKFDPERFLQDDPNRNPFAYIPFSAGSRNCIGQKYAMLEIKIIVSMLVKKFKILPSDINQELKLADQITLRSVNGIYVKLAHRNKQ